MDCDSGTPSFTPLPSLPPLTTCNGTDMVVTADSDDSLTSQLQLPELNTTGLPDQDQQSLCAATPIQLITPPNTPVTYMYNPYYSSDSSQGMVVSTPSVDTLTSTGTYPSATSCTQCMPGFSAYSAATNIGKLTHVFPMATVPLMHIAPIAGGGGDAGVGEGGMSTSTSFARVPYSPPYPSTGVPLAPISPFAAMPRTFPLLQGATATLFSPGNSYYSGQQDPQLVTPGYPLFQTGSSGFTGLAGYGSGAVLSGASYNGSNTDSNSGRPPYSFSALIAMAIMASPKKMRTLPDIYDYISEKFQFYRKDDKKWKNSVRHNLSLNKCFKKAPRQDGERLKGKGNYWIIDPNCDHVLERGSFRSLAKRRKKKRRVPQEETIEEEPVHDRKDPSEEKESGAKTESLLQLDSNLSTPGVLPSAGQDTGCETPHHPSGPQHHSDFGVHKLIGK